MGVGGGKMERRPSFFYAFGRGHAWEVFPGAEGLLGIRRSGGGIIPIILSNDFR